MEELLAKILNKSEKELGLELRGGIRNFLPMTTKL